MSLFLHLSSAFLRCNIRHFYYAINKRVHFVKINTGYCSVFRILNQISLIIDDHQKSEWMRYFVSYHSGLSEWYENAHLDQLPALLINAFSITELRRIIESIIKVYPTEIRTILNKSSQRKLLTGSAEQIAQNLTIDQIFQLALKIDNNSVVKLVEKLIDENVISIPPTELRSTNFKYTRFTAFEVVCQCSRYGIRAIPKKKNIAIIRLKKLITELYLDCEELKWKLRHAPGEDVTEKLEKFLFTVDLRVIISEFILSSQYYTIRAFKFLHFENFETPKTREEENFLIEKILWKLGFDIGLYPDYQKIFWERLDGLMEVSNTSTKYSEDRKEKIRSAAVNFFVSLEQVLDYSLSFICWALFQDHFSKTNFTYNLKTARIFSANYLNQIQTTGDQHIHYDTTGINTLYPLIEGFSLLARHGETLLDAEDHSKRTLNEFPVFHDKTYVYVFPFKHKILFFDIRQNDQKKILEMLNEVTYYLNKYKVANIRNRIEHKRDDFPNQDEIESSCRAIKEIMRKTQDFGIMPTLYLYAGSKKDMYGRGHESLVDYEGNEINIIQQNQYIRCKLPSLKVPQLILKGSHIHNSMEKIRFAYTEDSEFISMWSNFPKHSKEQILLDEGDEKTFQEKGVK